MNLTIIAFVFNFIISCWPKTNVKMSNCIKKYNFHIKLLKIGYFANDKWRQVPGLDLLHHILIMFTRT